MINIVKISLNRDNASHGELFPKKFIGQIWHKICAQLATSMQIFHLSETIGCRHKRHHPSERDVICERPLTQLFASCGNV